MTTTKITATTDDYRATLDLDEETVTIYRITWRGGYEWAGVGSWIDRSIHDCDADLGDEVYDDLDDALREAVDAHAEAAADEDLDDRTSYYRDGDGWVAVLTGMPEHHVQVGVGSSRSAARSALDDGYTPIQSTGPDAGEAAALRWAAYSGWIDSADTLTEAE